MKRFAVVLLLALISACSDTPTQAPATGAPPVARAQTAPPSLNIIDRANAQLQADGEMVRVAYVEFLTTSYFGSSENVIYARNVGNKRLTADFVPDDMRRYGHDYDGDLGTIDTWIDVDEGMTSSGLTAEATTDAITRAMATWQGVVCSDFGSNVIQVSGLSGGTLGRISYLYGFGGGYYAYDLMHAGWLPGGFFDLIAPNGSSFILGATFTWVFVDAYGPTDVNGDGLADVAFRETYYNDALNWADNGVNSYDVETVVLHESGHGLSQGHFGTVFLNPKSDLLIFSPRAVMNAVYSGISRELYGTDNAGHCGIWDGWPSN